MISCMGGQCKGRDKCANYHERGSEPVERLCGPDEEVDSVIALRNAMREMDGRQKLSGRLHPVQLRA